MTILVSKVGESVSIQLPELFGFSSRGEFKQATSGHPMRTKYLLDFRLVKKMDSSALGMLLLLREISGGASSDITLIHLQPDIRKLMHLANFQTLFKIP
ncbi:MAG: STAS domain-containing protein [Magnetococcus sp. YQC-5]